MAAEEVLSQSEIDALIARMTAGGGPTEEPAGDADDADEERSV